MKTLLWLDDVRDPCDRKIDCIQYINNEYYKYDAYPIDEIEYKVFNTPFRNMY